jgi:hypothetical protein
MRDYLWMRVNVLRELEENTIPVHTIVSTIIITVLGVTDIGGIDSRSEISSQRRRRQIDWT